MAIPQLNNGDSGLAARTIINNLVNSVNASPFPYTGSAKITGSLSVTGSISSTNQVAAEIFMHPQTITSNITIPADYNGFLVSPVGISGSIITEENANLIIM